MNISRYPVKIIIEGIGEAKAEFIRFLAPRTVAEIIQKLPIEGRASIWKDSEVYFEIPVTMGLEKSKEFCKKGTIAYWPVGNSLCIFFKDLEPYSPVSEVGRVLEGIELFELVKPGTKIRIERAT